MRPVQYSTSVALCSVRFRRWPCFFRPSTERLWQENMFSFCDFEWKISDSRKGWEESSSLGRDAIRRFSGIGWSNLCVHSPPKSNLSLCSSSKATKNYGDDFLGNNPFDACNFHASGLKRRKKHLKTCNGESCSTQRCETPLLARSTDGKQYDFAHVRRAAAWRYKPVSSRILWSNN